MLQALNETDKAIQHTVSNMEDGGDKLDAMGKRIASSLKSMASAFAAQQFIEKTIQVRGEFQKLEASFRTMLGSEEKAVSFMEQLTRTAATTPFGLNEVASGAKQLLAYGTSAEEVNGILIRLGDIAAGLSIPLGDLIYLYGTTMAQGRMFTVDFRQFMGRGVPIAEELAKQFGVAESKVGDLVTAGKVGAKEFKAAIESMTDAGGKFGGLMEEQSKTISGQISNIGDSIDMMFNDIGKSSESVINDALSGISYLVENWQKVGEQILEVVAAYGAYKAVLITLSAIEKARLTATLALGAAEKTVSTAKAIHLAITNSLTAAQARLNSVMAKNPYTLAAMAVAGLAYGIYKAVKATNELSGAQKVLADTDKEYQKDLVKEQLKIDKLFHKLRTAEKGTKDYNAAKQSIMKNYGSYLTKLGDEKTALNDIAKAYEAVTTGAKNAAKARAMNKFMEESGDTYIEGIANVRERVHDFLKGRGLSESTIGKMLDDFTAATRGEKKIREAFLEQFDESIIHTTSAGTPYTSEYNYMRDYFEEGKNLYRDFAKAKKDAEIKYGKYNPIVPDPQIEPEPTTELTDAEKEALQKAAEKRAKARQGIADQILDLENKLRQKEIDNQKENTLKKLNQIDLDYDLQIQEIEKKAKELANKNQEAGIKTGLNLNGLTKEQQDLIDKSKAGATEGRNKLKFDLMDEELEKGKESMLAYLTEYGTFQEKRKAIRDKYQSEIEKAETEGAKLSLQKEMQQALSELNFEKLKKDMNWELIFSDLSSASKKELEAVKKQLKDFKKSPEYAAYTPEQKKIIEDALNSIQTNIVDKGGLLGDLPGQLQELAAAQEELAAAQEALNAALAGGTDAEIEAAQARKNAAEQFVKKQQLNVAKSQDKTLNNLNAVGDALTRLGSSAELSLADLGGMASTIAQIAGATGAVGGIIQGLMGLMDMIDKQGLDGFVKNIFSSIGGSLKGLVKFSPAGLVAQAFGFDFGGADYSGYEKMVGEYNGLIEIWEELISKKQEYIDIDYGDEARKAGKEALELVEKLDRSQRELARERLGAGASAGSHSQGYRMWNQWSSGNWSYYAPKISEELGITFDSMDDMTRMTAEQLEYIKENYPTAWSKMDYAFKNHLENIIEYSERLDEIKDKMNEAITGVSFDSFYDSYVSMLSDLEKDNDDFAQDLSEKIKNAFIANLVANKYRGRIEKLYEDWAQMSDSDGDGVFDLTKSEVTALQEAQKALTDEMIAEREALADTFGWGDGAYSQEASKKGFAAMSEDTGEELNGRFTAMQESMQNLVALASGSSATLSDSLLQHVLANRYLEDIQKDTRRIYVEFGEKIDRIVSNTQNL